MRRKFNGDNDTNLFLKVLCNFEVFCFKVRNNGNSITYI